MSWMESAAGAPFDVSTLPYGVGSGPVGTPRVLTRVGDQVIDLYAVAHETRSDCEGVLDSGTLDPILRAGPQVWSALRQWVRALVEDEAHRDVVTRHLHPAASHTMRLPFTVADYVDFYASESHASNVGKIFRPDAPALPASWKHLPIGYHGRAGTVVVSGTDVVRPKGQRRPGGDGVPPFGPTQRLDIECEVGFVVGGSTALGQPVSVDAAPDHLFGVVLLNDWSARDIQAWEYVPLGPFLGKSFATSISAWVVPMEALESAYVEGPPQDPSPLPYLQPASTDVALGLDLHLEVDINGTVVATPSFRDMYWSPAQMLAHMTVNGASIRPGDLFASGTVSGPERGQRGCLLELTWNGTDPLVLDDGATRGFLEDGDVVTLRGWAPGADGSRITLGEVTGRILPAG
jgi:fumarylacetoacetase